MSKSSLLVCFHICNNPIKGNADLFFAGHIADHSGAVGQFIVTDDDRVIGIKLIGRLHLAFHAAAQEVDFSIEAFLAESLLEFEGLGLRRIAEGDDEYRFFGIHRAA